ncbi:SAM domain-containing protein [Mycena chlorophos]|uniref:RNA-binding protein VTS1 n=1 Tax=Mycena chlorophos TaxID=658473 RepID=A0A8H6W3Q3_MYCCL|nr:SAM domain-containing protein [Mycena chlorophos]
MTTSTPPQLASVELQAPSSRLSPLPSPRPGAGFVPPVSPRFASGPNGKPEGEGLDEWFEDLSKYEATLAAMAEASTDPKFSEELGTIEAWFRVLNEAEKTAALYTLLQTANPSQIRFLIAVLQQMLGPNPPPTASIDGGSFQVAQAAKPQAQSQPRPANLNLALPKTPRTPQPLSALRDLTSPLGDWATAVPTPSVPMFGKPKPPKPVESPLPPMPMGAFPGMMNPLMLGQMGVTSEAQLSQLLAMQMMMSGMPMPPPQNMHQKNKAWRGGSGTGGGRFPGSALRGGTQTKSGAAKPASGSNGTTPREDEVDPELLKDVPSWLRSLRLHKYTACFEGMTWQEMVELDEATLEAKGVAALGARRRLIKTFDNVKEKMGLAPPKTAETAD